jgi:urease accessory protein
MDNPPHVTHFIVGDSISCTLFKYLYLGENTMSIKYILGVLMTIISLVMTPVVQAHPLITEEISWLKGFTHPFLGLDHLLAMLAVGLWASQQGGSRLWQLPVAFLGMMMFGALLGHAGFSLPLVEEGIASSLLVLCLMLAFAIRLPVLPGMLMVGIFAVFHGYAHGAEMPQTLALTDYALGFMLATGILHGLGISFGLLIQDMQSEKLLRLGGIAIGVRMAWLWI